MYETFFPPKSRLLMSSLVFPSFASYYRWSFLWFCRICFLFCRIVFSASRFSSGCVIHVLAALPFQSIGKARPQTHLQTRFGQHRSVSFSSALVWSAKEKFIVRFLLYSICENNLFDVRFRVCLYSRGVCAAFILSPRRGTKSVTSWGWKKLGVSKFRIWKFSNFEIQKFRITNIGLRILTGVFQPKPSN